MKQIQAVLAYIALALAAGTAVLAVFQVGVMISHLAAKTPETPPEAAKVEPVAAPVKTAAVADAVPAPSQAPAAPAPAAAIVSAEAGEALFKKCKACHTYEKGGKNGTGPNLWGVVQAPIARHTDFKYSDTMVAKSGETWSVANLESFLTKPKDFVTRTKMSFAGLKKPEERASVVAFLAQQSDTPLSVEELGLASAAATGTPAAAAEPAAPAEPVVIEGYHNPAPKNAAELAEIETRVAALRAEVEGIDYQRARYHRLHFPPAIETASSAECLVCHQEIMEDRPLAVSPAGIRADETLGWYQLLDTYEGDQQSFHWRHLESPYAKQVMNLECNFCHKGNDPREESPDMVPGRAAMSSAPVPEFTNRKMVNPSETCLLCHGAMPDPENIMGLGAAWPEARLDLEDAETINGCLSCHGEGGFRPNRHAVSYLNAANIETLARAKNDTCYGCHGGRSWYRISYPYPRHPWEDMDSETPDWAVGRPAQSKPEYQLPAAD